MYVGIEQMIDQPYCLDSWHPLTRLCHCTCMTKAVSGLTYSSDELNICFARKQKKEQQHIVIGSIRDSKERRAKEPCNRRKYFLPGVSSVFICEHAFRNWHESKSLADMYVACKEWYSPHPRAARKILPAAS